MGTIYGPLETHTHTQGPLPCTLPLGGGALSEVPPVTASPAVCSPLPLSLLLIEPPRASRQPSWTEFLQIWLPSTCPLDPCHSHTPFEQQALEAQTAPHAVLFCPCLHGLLQSAYPRENSPLQLQTPGDTCALPELSLRSPMALMGLPVSVAQLAPTGKTAASSPLAAACGSLDCPCPPHLAWGWAEDATAPL